MDVEDRPAWPEELVQRYGAAGHWRGATFGQLLRDWAARWSARTAVVDGETRLTYAELDEAVDRLAGGLQSLGLRSGDRVVVQLPNSAGFVVLWFAFVRMGVIPVHAQPGHRATEITHLARTSGAVAYVCPDRLARFDHRPLAEAVRAEIPSVEHVIVAGEPLPGQVALGDLAHGPAFEPGPSAEPGDVALLLLSGGTTGAPKLIPRTHDDYAYNARAAAEICRMGPDDVYLAVLPIAFNFTMSCPGVLGALSVGATVVVAHSPDAGKAFPLIEREKVTITALNPPLAPYWIEEAAVTEHDLSSLRLVQIGSARLADDVARRVEPALGARLQQVFGMAEGLLCLTRLDDPEDLRCTTQGKPISPDDEIRVVGADDLPVPPGEPGELLTRGPYTLRGYYRAAEHNLTAFTADGFYRTGDIVRQLPTGHLVVVGRAKDQINRGGEKIAATEVEGHLLAHPEITGAALVAAPDPKWGERSVAFLVCRESRPDRRELAAFLRSRGVAAYKYPDQIEHLAELPLTAVGKVDKNALRARLAVQQ
ncbi:(2,3-dihydroxybenzoyl)adenylate synthase [Amycolatopsis sp. H6(2020)]|nr:(2,3-dihydroxybenzoyl)adenylate synthase [Amycolatopsis sp. H6(2020)]